MVPFSAICVCGIWPYPRTLLFLKVAQFAMYRHQNLGPDPLIHFHQLFRSGGRIYDETVLLRDDVDAHTGKLVLDPANREFVPRNFRDEK